MFRSLKIFISICFLLFCLPIGGACAQGAAEIKNILVLHGLGDLDGWEEEFDASFYATISKNPATPVAVSYDFVRVGGVPEEIYPQNVTNPADLVIATLPLANDFLLAYGEDLFPGIPKIFALPNSAITGWIKQLPNALIFQSSAAKALDNTVSGIFSVLPRTKRLVVVGGTSKTDYAYMRWAQKAIESQNRGENVTIEYMVGLPVGELLETVAKLPADTAILFVTYEQDMNNNLLRSLDVVSLLSENANAPVFGFFNTLLGRGIVGGNLTSPKFYGQKTAEFATQIIQGKELSAIPTEEEFSEDMFDWRQLKRWHILEESLPPDSIIRFKTETFWEMYKVHIIIAFGVMCLQAILIVALFLTLKRARRVESNLRENQEQLRASEQKFKGIFNNAYQFIGLLSPEGVLLEVNESALAFIDQKQENVVGKFFWDTPWWNYSKDLQENLKKSVETATAGRIVHQDVIHWDQRGKKIYVDFSLKPIMDEEGKIRLLVAEGRDISHQKLSELRFKTLFNTASDAILIMKEDKFVECNPKALEIYGCTHEQLLQATPDEFSPQYQPDGSNSRQGAIEKINKAYAGENPVFEWKHTRYDGTQFDAEVSLNVAEFEGEKFLQAIVRDITNRKKTEIDMIRLASAIEQAAEEIVMTDNDGVIEYVNPAFERTTGYNRSEVIGQKPSILKSGKHDDVFYQNLWGTIKNGDVWSGRLINKRKDGSEFVEDATISPVYTSKGEGMGFVCVKRDITEQLKLETQLRQAQKMESIGTLAGGIAHDFNNILSAIFDYTELAKMRAQDNPNLTDDLNEVQQAGMRAKDLVKQILTFSRMSEMEKKPFQVALVVKEALKLLRSSLPSTIEIKQNIISKEHVLADSTQIHQIIMNLCTNAYYAMKDQGGTLSVTLQDAEIKAGDILLGSDLRPGKYLRLEIGDTGCGMDKNTKDKIFEPYFTTKEKGEGTGLGLAVVHGIVQGHGGQIHVYSEPGQGTTFSVYLPKIQKQGYTLEGGENELAIEKGTEHIMFVDDEEKIVNLAGIIFSENDYTITTFTNGKDALHNFEIHPGKYDLVITDQTMPGMMGTEMIAKMLAIRPNLPVILCTGYSATINRQEALGMGITEYIQKPVAMSSLIRTVRNIFDKAG